MFPAQFLLVIIIASAGKAIPITEDYPEPQTDPINPNIDYYTTQEPDTDVGLSLFLLLQISLKKDIAQICDVLFKDVDLNLTVRIFAGIEEVSRNIKEVLARKAQSNLNEKESHNNGNLQGLLQSSGNKLELKIDESFNDY